MRNEKRQKNKKHILFLLHRKFTFASKRGSTIICPTSDIVCFSGIYFYILPRRKICFFSLDIELFGYPDLRTYQFVSPRWYYHLYHQVLLVCCKFNVMWHKVMLHPRFSDTQTSMNGSLFYGNFQVFLFCLRWGGGVSGDLWFAGTYYYHTEGIDCYHFIAISQPTVAQNIHTQTYKLTLSSQTYILKHTNWHTIL